MSHTNFENVARDIEGPLACRAVILQNHFLMSFCQLSKRNLKSVDSLPEKKLGSHGARIGSINTMMHHPQCDLMHVVICRVRRVLPLRAHTLDP